MRVHTIIGAILVGCASGCADPKDADIEAVLSEDGFSAPIPLVVNLVGVYRGAGEGDSELAALLHKSGILAIRPYLDADPWWVFAYAGEYLPNHRFEFHAGIRSVTGRSGVRRWKQNSLRFYSTTVSFALLPDPQFKLPSEKLGPFAYRLIMYFNPSTGRWEGDGNYVDRDEPEQRKLLRELLVAKGGEHLDALRAAAASARADAADTVADNLINSGALAPGPAPNILTNSQAGLMYLVDGGEGGFMVQPTVNQIAAHCEAVDSGGFSDWRWAKRAEFDRILTLSRRGDAVKLLDAPDNRFWRPLLALIPDGDAGIRASIDSFNRSYSFRELQVGRCWQACGLDVYNVFLDGTVSAASINIAHAQFSNPLAPPPNLLRLNEPLNMSAVPICVRNLDAGDDDSNAEPDLNQWRNRAHN